MFHFCALLKPKRLPYNWIMNKIDMKTPVAELDGDEMARVLWNEIKENLIKPFVNLKTEYYDLSLQNRDATGDEVTKEAAFAIKRLGVGVKCATITANAQRQKEYGLKQIYKSPNATIRSILDGTVFREPIKTGAILPLVSCWKKPIVIGRHAYGDVYGASEFRANGPCKVELCVTGEDGVEERIPVAKMNGAGVVLAMHNLDESIRNFARSCFYYALDKKIPVWFSAKDTISKTYDGRFKDIFLEIYETEFREKCEKANISYFYTLIDDAVSRAMRSEGGFLWACKNYDGDVMSDMIASACGSLAMMTSALVSPSGAVEYEAAHGTVQKHYYRHIKGEKTSTNPCALLFAWTGALGKRAALDGLNSLGTLASTLEKAAKDAVCAGVVTADLAGSFGGKKGVSSSEFIAEIKKRTERLLKDDVL